jgi:hypothetical protein
MKPAALLLLLWPMALASEGPQSGLWGGVAEFGGVCQYTVTVPVLVRWERLTVALSGLD